MIFLCLGLLWDARLDVWTEQLHQFSSRFTEMAAKMARISSSRELRVGPTFLTPPLSDRPVERGRGTTKVSEAPKEV